MDAHKLIPLAASNITIYTSGYFRTVVIADFDISEENFVVWAAQEGKELRELQGMPEIPCAHSWSMGYTNGFHAIINGLYYEKRDGSGDDVCIAYCRHRRRGFIAQIPR